MTEMPERIRAMWCREEWFGEGPLGPEPVAMKKRHVGGFNTDATGTEFIRADLVEELVKALEEAREEFLYWHPDCGPDTPLQDQNPAGPSRVVAKIDAALARIDALKEK